MSQKRPTFDIRTALRVLSYSGTISAQGIKKYHKVIRWAKECLETESDSTFAKLKIATAGWIIYSESGKTFCKNDAQDLAVLFLLQQEGRKLPEHEK